MRGVGVLLFLVACAAASLSPPLPNSYNTCSGENDIKLVSTEIEGDVSTDPASVRLGTGGIFYVDDSSVFILTSTRKLYSSDDGGETLFDESADMEGSDSPAFPYLTRRGVHALAYSADGKTVVALSYKEGYWVKQERRAWVWKSTPNKVWKTIKAHPTRSGVFAATAKSKACYGDQYPGVCLQTVYQSSDTVGARWDVVYESSTGQFDWSSANPDYLFVGGYVDVTKDYRTLSYYETNVWRHSLRAGAGSFKLIREHQAGMLYIAKSSLLLIATNEASDGSKRRLWTSEDEGETVEMCTFPEDSSDDEMSYNIMDTDEGSVFVMVRRQSQYDRGDVYISSTFKRNFKLSLPGVVSRGIKGDLSEVQAMEGTYLANVYEAPDDSIMSYITFDNGGLWEPLSPPDGSPECRGQPECYLNLLGRSQSSIGSPPHSSPTAVGLILGTGNVGPSLRADEGEVDTFMSRDGGYTWTTLASGDNHFGIADRGGLILVAKRGSDAVSEFQWSYNEGTSWIPCTIASTEIMGLFTTPSQDGSSFLLVSRASGITTLTKVDFSNLASIVCRAPEAPGTANSDYEYFTVGNDNGCILGHVTQYVRKKQNARCWNTYNQIEHKVTNCACSREDYECAPCYEEDWFSDSYGCVKIPGCVMPLHCMPGETTYLEGNYRKLATDTCTPSAEGANYEPVVKSCMGVVNTVAPTPSPTQRGGTHSPTTSGGTSSGSAAPTPAPSTGGNGPAIAAVIIILLVIAAGVVAFVVLRKRPGMRARFPNAPTWLIPDNSASSVFDSSFTSPGELDGPAFGDSDFDGDF